MKETRQFNHHYHHQCFEEVQCRIFGNESADSSQLSFQQRNKQKISIKNINNPQQKIEVNSGNKSLKKSLKQSFRSSQNINIRGKECLQISNRMLIEQPKQKKISHQQFNNRINQVRKNQKPRIHIKVINDPRKFNSPPNRIYCNQTLSQQNNIKGQIIQKISSIDRIYEVKKQDNENQTKEGLQFRTKSKIANDQSQMEMSKNYSIQFTTDVKKIAYNNQQINDSFQNSPPSTMSAIKNQKNITKTKQLKKFSKSFEQRKYLFSSQNIQKKLKHKRTLQSHQQQQDLFESNQVFLTSNSQVKFIKTMKQIQEIFSVKDEDQISISRQQSVVLGRLNHPNANQNSFLHQKLFTFNVQNHKKNPPKRLMRYESLRQ